jgi:hypothetical protein
MTPADGVVAVGVLVLAGGLAAASQLPSRHSGSAIVTVGRQVVLEVPLGRDAEHVVAARRGKVTLAVEGGAIRVSRSGCPQQICVRMGAKRRPGELLACVPNALVVKLAGVDPDAPDAVTR